MLTIARKIFTALSLRACLKWTGSLAIILTLVWLGAGLSISLAMKRLGPLPLSDLDNSSILVVDRQDRLLRAFTTTQGRWRLPISSNQVDQRYQRMLIAYEDKRFYDHPGVDIRAILRAGWQYIRNGRIISGASTLTMQVARLLEPHALGGSSTQRQKHAIKTKARQMLRALQLEQRFSKQEILDLYLKLAPMGGNLEGVRAASLAYFGREPKRLTLAQSALLVAIPQSPTARRPERHPSTAKKARNRVLARLAKANVISRNDALSAQSEPISSCDHARCTMRRRSFPKLAAHLAQAEVSRDKSAKVHRLTIDASLQKRLEKLARNGARSLGARHSVAMIALDHQTGQILASVGGADFLDDNRFGQIDMTRAVRSPGSALKPFIYGMAFDQGLAHPETLIEDKPARFDDYAPENFDGEYAGTVSLRKALQLSLNVPAVKLLHRLGPARLLARFRQAGVNLKLPKNAAPNLSMALGGLGLSLHELTALYTGLARGGDMVTLYHRRTGKPTRSPQTNPRRLISNRSAWYIADILAGSPPPVYAKGGKIAYKTGTSYGYRDAWAIGFDGAHVIGVWVGRPDGTASPGMTGRTAAAPILFDAFQRLSKTRAPLPAPPVEALMATNADLPRPLQYFEQSSAELARFQRGGTVPAEPVKIVFPPDGAGLDVGATDNGFDMVILKATGGMLPLTWLIDGTPLEAGSRSRRGSPSARRRGFWKPAGRGFARLGVIDANGNADSVMVRVQGD